MFRYQIATISLALFLHISWGHIENFQDFSFLETFNQDVEGSEESKHHVDKDPVEPVWVLDLELNMLDSLKLRKANEFEISDFQKSVGSLIARAKTRRGQQRPTSNQHPETSPHVITNSEKHDHKASVKEIMAMINKFITSAVGIERDSRMPETTDIHETPSLALYLQGPYSAVLLKYGRTEWKFFFSYPSPLPDWFYEDHNDCVVPDAKYIPVPAYVEDQFYDTFAQLLKLFFRVEM